MKLNFGPIYGSISLIKMALYMLLSLEEARRNHPVNLGWTTDFSRAFSRYSATSGKPSSSCHGFPSCKMDRVIENLNLGSCSQSTAPYHTSCGQLPRSSPPGSHILLAPRRLHYLCLQRPLNSLRKRTIFQCHVLQFLKHSC